MIRRLQLSRDLTHAARSLAKDRGFTLICPERGLVVAVITNTSYADTESLALKIAQAFAEK